MPHQTTPAKTTTSAKPAKNYLRYIGLASQMAGSLLLFAFLGQWLDKYFQLSRPYLTVVCCLFSIAGTFFILFRELTKDDKSAKRPNPLS